MFGDPGVWWMLGTAATMLAWPAGAIIVGVGIAYLVMR